MIILKPLKEATILPSSNKHFYMIYIKIISVTINYRRVLLTSWLTTVWIHYIRIYITVLYNHAEVTSQAQVLFQIGYFANGKSVIWQSFTRFVLPDHRTNFPLLVSGELALCVSSVVCRYNVQRNSSDGCHSHIFIITRVANDTHPHTIDAWHINTLLL